MPKRVVFWSISVAENYFHQGFKAEDVGDLGLAESLYKLSLLNNPRSTGSLVNLGTIYFNQGKFFDAEGLYQYAVDVDPNYTLAHFNLACLYEDQRNRANSLKHYLRAIEISPKYADAYYNLAFLYKSLGLKDKSAECWVKYIELDPRSNWTATAKRELSRLEEELGERKVTRGFGVVLKRIVNE